MIVFRASLPGARGAAGVTLLELLIVLMLMALIAGMVIPTVGAGASMTELKSSARQVAAGLRLARSQAIAQRAESFLVLDLGARTFNVPPDPQVHRLSDHVELKLFTAQKDLVNEQVGAIRFFPDGGSNGGRVTITSGARKFDVDIDWLTGRVAILD